LKEHIPWNDLPGYIQLVRAFLVELKIKDSRRYPDSFLKASYALLKNEKLLNPFVTVLYNKTK